MWAVMRGHWQLLGLIAAIALLWQTPVLVPLRILVVFLHELAHAVTVLLTGGEVLSLTITPREGGQVMARGGNRFLALSAGYTGSLLIGAALFTLAVHTGRDRAVLGALGLVMLAVAALYVRDGFALIFSVAAGGLMVLTARFLPRDVNDLILRVIGLSSMIYAPLDIYSDTIARSQLRSDARMLAEEFGGTTMIWGGFWLAISLAVIVFAVRRGLVRDSNIRFGA